MKISRRYKSRIYERKYKSHRPLKSRRYRFKNTSYRRNKR